MLLSDLKFLRERVAGLLKPSASFEALHPRAVLPTLAHGEDVGYDLRCLHDVTLKPLTVTRVKTGVAIRECHGGLWPIFPKIEGRSSVSEAGAFPVGGIIEPAYRGGIDVLLFSAEERKFTAGSKIAQLVFYRFCKPAQAPVQSDAPRGAAGFGSSGV